MTFGPGDNGHIAEHNALRDLTAAQGVAIANSDTTTAARVTNPGTATGAAVASAATTVAAARTPGFIGGAQSRVLARIGLRDAAPVVILLLGTSQVEGITSTDWPYLLNQNLQSVWPLSVGDPSPPIRTMDDYIADPTLVAGVQIINVGISGSTAATILPGANQAAAEALAPYVALYIIDTGTNDKETGVSPASFGASLVSELAPVRAASGPATWVYVHGNERISWGGSVNPAPWDDYRAQKEAIVATNPDDSILLDLSEVFRGLGVGFGGSDPLGLVSDTVHYTAAGNAFYFEGLRNALQIPSAGRNASIPAPDGIWVLTNSDAFTGGDDADIAGRAFDNSLGGAASVSWTNSPAATAAIVSGALVHGATTGNFFAGAAATSVDERYVFTLKTRQTTGSTGLVFALARASAAGGAVQGVGLAMASVASGGAITATYRDSGGSHTMHGGTLGTLADGDTFEVTRRGLTVSIFRNGSPLLLNASIGTELTGTGYYGIVGGTTNVGWEIDDVMRYVWDPA